MTHVLPLPSLHITSSHIVACLRSTGSEEFPSCLSQATPKLYMVLAEIDVRPPYNRRVIFHNFLTIPLPNADGLSAAQKKQNVGVKTTVQSVTASDSNTFILDLRRDLKQIAQTPEGKILVTKLFDYMLGLWDGKDKYDERDAYLPGTGKVKMNLSVAIKCSPGYGPPGDCSYQSPCSRAVLPVQQQQQSDLGGGGGGGQKKRSRRSAPGPPVQPCTGKNVALCSGVRTLDPQLPRWASIITVAWSQKAVEKEEREGEHDALRDVYFGVQSTLHIRHSAGHQKSVLTHEVSL